MKIVVPFLLFLSHVVLGSTPWPVAPYNSTTLQCQGDPDSCLWRIDYIMLPIIVEMTMIDIKNGTYLFYGHSDNSTGECDLLIENFEPLMSGSFACISKNTLANGTVTEEILQNYTAIAQELSDFFVSYDDQRYENHERIRPNLIKNETYVFVCGVSATPTPPNIKWIFNNTRDITADSVLTQPHPSSSPEFISTLTLETSASGEQSLACVIRKDYATQEEIISVNFVVGDIDLEPNVYTSTILPCDVDSDSCVWEIETRDGEMNSYNMTEIKEGLYPKYGYSFKSIGDCDLLIKETVLADAGHYVCNDLNMLWESYRLTIYELSHPTLSFDGKTYNDYDELEDDLPLDQTYEFQCEVERAFPEPTIKWLHNEEGDVTEYSEMEVVQSDSNGPLRHVGHPTVNVSSSSYTNTLFFNVKIKGLQSLQCVVTHLLISDKETVTLIFGGGSATIGVSAFSLVSVLVLVVMPTYLHY